MLDVDELPLALRTRQCREVWCQGVVRLPLLAQSWVDAVPGGLGEAVVNHTRKARQVADMAYVALVIGIFGLLALMLRGMEKI